MPGVPDALSRDRRKTVKKAVVLLSGGLDSTTCLAMAKAQGFEPVCLTIEYGQRHAVELERARELAQAMGVADFRVVRLGLRAVGGSASPTTLPSPRGAATPSLNRAFRRPTCPPETPPS